MFCKRLSLRLAVPVQWFCTRYKPLYISQPTYAKQTSTPQGHYFYERFLSVSFMEYASPSSLREMSNSLWLRPKELASTEWKIVNLHKFRKRGQPRKVYPNFLGISRTFGWMFCFSEIQQFPDFLELFPGNFCTICLRFKNFGIFGRMVSALGVLIVT